MKYFIIFVFLVVNFLNPAIAQQQNPRQLLNKSIAHHDPDGKWSETKLNVHIQEPRIRNSYRYSIVRMDNASGSFELSRNRGEHISTHIINGDGSSEAVLDGEKITDSDLISQYRLGKEMNMTYKNMYDMMLGLPMSLTDENIAEYGSVENTEFNDEQAKRVSIVLKNELFSKYWNIMLSAGNSSILGIEIYFPDDPEKGERLYFDGEFEFDGIRVPRFRHWHEYSDDSYSGSDVIVRGVTEQ